MWTAPLTLVSVSMETRVTWGHVHLHVAQNSNSTWWSSFWKIITNQVSGNTDLHPKDLAQRTEWLKQIKFFFFLKNAKLRFRENLLDYRTLSMAGVLTSAFNGRIVLTNFWLKGKQNFFLRMQQSRVVFHYNYLDMTLTLCVVNVKQITPSSNVPKR